MRRRSLGVFVSLISLALISGFTAYGPEAQAPSTSMSGFASASSPATSAAQAPQTSTVLDETLDPKHTALLIHEMVNDIAARYTAEQKATLVPRLQKLVAAAHQKGVRVIYLRYTAHADDSTNSDAIRRNLLSGEPDDRTTIEGTQGWEVIDALKPEPQDLVLRKYRPDAFYGTILDSMLRWNGIKTVVIAGLGLSVGIIPTIASAENLGYFRVAVGDGLLSYDPKRTSDALAYLSEHAGVRTHTDVIDSWNRSPARPSGVVASTRSAQDSELASVIYEGREIPVSMDEILNPKHTAVLVHQMQNDFLSPGGACEKLGCMYDSTRVKRIVPAIQRLLGAARAKNVPVVYLRRTSLPGRIGLADPRMPGPAATEPRTPSARPVVEGTRGWEIVDALKPEPGDVILPTYRPDAFFGTILDAVLRSNGIRTVVFVGVDSDTGGLQTLMRAWYLGYFRVTISNGHLPAKDPPMTFAATYLDAAVPKTDEEVVAIWNRHLQRRW